MCYVNCEVMIMWKKAALAALSLLCLCAAYLRPVYSVSLPGTELNGTWSAREIAEAERLAGAAAEELTGSAANTPEPETRARLSLAPAEGGTLELAEALLAASDGVELAWEVSVDGVDIGRVSDTSALGEAVLDYIAEGAPPGCVSASLTSDVSMREVFVPEGGCDDTMDVTARLRELTRVSYVAG